MENPKIWKVICPECKRPFTPIRGGVVQRGHARRHRGCPGSEVAPVRALAEDPNGIRILPDAPLCSLVELKECSHG